MPDKQQVETPTPVSPTTQENRQSHPHGPPANSEAPPSGSCRRCYERLRQRVWRRLTGTRTALPGQLALPVVCMIAVVLDLPIRWIISLLDSIIGDAGYLTVGSIVGGYLVVFGLIDAKHQQEDGRASFERSQFITMVSAGNVESLVEALKTFGQVQTMRVTKHPQLFRPWNWGDSSQPNRESLHQWANERFSSCEKAACSKIDSRIDLGLANLRFTDMSNLNLSDANLRYADLTGANLSGATLNLADLSLALLAGTNLSGATLFRANLSYANLSNANLDNADLTGAKYNNATEFPAGFDPKARGMILGP